MRAGVQDMHREKHDSEAPEKPVGNDGIGQKTSAESVQRK
jgi:hypothetical protein